MKYRGSEKPQNRRIPVSYDFFILVILWPFRGHIEPLNLFPSETSKINNRHVIPLTTREWLASVKLYCQQALFGTIILPFLAIDILRSFSDLFRSCQKRLSSSERNESSLKRTNNILENFFVCKMISTSVAGTFFNTIENFQVVAFDFQVPFLFLFALNRKQRALITQQALPVKNLGRTSH